MTSNGFTTESKATEAGHQAALWLRWPRRFCMRVWRIAKRAHDRADPRTRDRLFLLPMAGRFFRALFVVHGPEPHMWAIFAGAGQFNIVSQAC